MVVTTEDILQHAGVKGMKWGVRKERDKSPKLRKAEGLALKGVVNQSVKLPNGETISVERNKPSSLSKFLKAVSPKMAAEQERTAILTLKNSDGKKIGDAQFYRESKDELNLVWLGVKTSERGRGVGTSMVSAAIGYGKSNGLKKLTLEVPGDSPDARHIYEKLGFKAKKVISDSDDGWGGLTTMEMDISKDKTLKQSVTTEDILQHAGVKGMKWGVRKKEYKSNKKQIAKDYKSGKISKAERNTKSLENFHESKGKLSSYKRNYNRRVKMGMNSQKAKVFGQFENSALKAMNYAQLVTMTATAVGVGKPIVQAAARAYMSNPNTIRKGKNIVASFKRSPVRYVDGSTLTNVVNAGIKFQKQLNQPSLRIGHSVNLSDEEILLHFGTKGMKWGVRKERKAFGQNGSNKDSKPKKSSRLKEEFKSLKRENSWTGKLGNADKMSTKEIKGLAKRAQLENDLKRLAGKNPKLKKEYRNRESMSDQELNRKVDRLRAIDSLNRNSNEATKRQREIGKKIVNTASPLIVKYALTKEITSEDIMNAWSNPEKVTKDAVLDTIKKKAK